MTQCESPIVRCVNENIRVGQKAGSMEHGYFIEDIEPGMTAMFGKTITEADILMFAGVSG